jgi:hypothetical protein
VYESRRDPLLPRPAFILRLLRNAAAALGIVGFSWGLGMAGYRIFEGMSWLDAMLNSAMLLGGMGPTSELHTSGGKIFASFYALYCGLVLIMAVGVLFAPVFHRFIHKFHLEEDEEEAETRDKSAT